MNQVTLTIFFYAALLIVLILSSCVIYLAFSYRRILEKYSELQRKKEYGQLADKMKADTNDLVKGKVQEAIAKATQEGVKLISQNAQDVAKDVRKKAIEELISEEKAEEQAIAGEYDKTRAEIQKYKEQKFEEVRQSASKLLSEVAQNVLKKAIDPKEQEEIILKSLEDAKRSGFF